jgi:diguanylate cyclase (GGDEF)-like protein
MFGDALRSAGHRVETAPDTEAAISLLERMSFDVVICDVRAPRIDGLSLLRRLQRDQPKVEVILTAFRPGVPEAALALAEGASDYLIKPFDLDDAVLRVSRSQLSPDSVEHERTCALLLSEDGELSTKILDLIERSGESIHVDHLKRFQDANLKLRKRGRNLSAAGVFGGRLDVIICALPMTGFGDLDVVLELMALAPELPLVVVGGSGDEKLAMRTVQVGAQELLPADELDVKRLVRAIRYAIERKRAEQRLVYLAHHDHLTGLANRTLFRERLSHARARSRRDKRKLAMMFLDLDRFKSINDTLGHEAGDAVLREIAKRLRHAVRDQDTVARLGGDELAVLLEDVADKKEVALIAERVLEVVKEPITVDRDQLVVTTSIGIAVSPDVWDTTADLVSSADKAMYLAKERGPGNYFMFGDDRSRSRAEDELRQALEKDELVLHYQPLRTALSNQVIGAEALLRWQRPDGVLIPPADFVPFLEETGLIVEVGARVLMMACREASSWKNQGANQRVSVNLSAVQLERDDLSATVMSALADSKIDAQGLELEITESVLMRDTARAQATLFALKSRGVRIAIDDFGTGYSSLAYLHRFPVDTLKIDRGFVRQIGDGGNGAAIVGAIIGLAHKLSIEVVAEGVETEQQLEFLRNEGCDLIQGYLLGKPEPAAQLPFKS